MTDIQHLLRTSLRAVAIGSSCLALTGLPLVSANSTPADGPSGVPTTGARPAAYLTDTVPLRRLVVGSTGLPLLSVLGVDRDGHLSPTAGSPFSTGVFSLGLAITPDARTVYTTHTVSGQLIGYRISDTGALSRINGATINAGAPVVGVAVSPDGKRLFVTVGMLPAQIRSYDIAADGSLAPSGASPTPVAGALFSQVSITPDGRHLVFTDWAQNQVSSFAIEPDASLTQVGGALATGEKPVMPIFTPDGRYVYVSNEISGTISGYEVASNGRLTPTPGSPYPALTAHGASVSPDGRHLYVSDTGQVGGFAIEEDGALTKLPGSPYAAQASRVVLSPDGRRVFAVDGMSAVRTLIRHEDGTLTPSGDPATNTGVVFSDGQIAAITPNIGPAAVLAVAARKGLSVTFTADGSDDPDGRVARYSWDFGDGSRVVTTVPTVTHRYADGSAQVATVTVTDDEGCSTELIYTGTTATCTGTATATARVATH
jgi:6-phosphogluconolactonase